MQKKIAIIGAGYAGLNLALRLQAAQVDVTLFTNKTAEDMENGPLLNTVARHWKTLDMERQLGLQWDEAILTVSRVHMSITGAQPFGFTGYMEPNGSFQDTRTYTASLLREFAARGGEVVVRNLEVADLETLSEAYDLVVVAGGNRALVSLFPRLAEHSPYDQPQRFLMAGYFDGIDFGDGGFHFVIAPGHGEIFQAVSYSHKGMVAQILIEGIYGQGFQGIEDHKYKDDLVAFKAALLAVIKEHAPMVYERIDVDKFAPLSPLDIMQGAVTPTVRQAYAQLPNGKYVVAVGDAHVTNDPTVGQGANTGIACAWILADQILGQDVYDLAFCQNADQAMWNYAQYPTQWANAALMPPPPHMIDLLVSAAQNQAIANAFVNNMATPDQQWTILSDPANTAAFIARHMENVPA